METDVTCVQIVTKETDVTLVLTVTMVICAVSCLSSDSQVFRYQILQLKPKIASDKQKQNKFSGKEIAFSGDTSCDILKCLPDVLRRRLVVSLNL